MKLRKIYCFFTALVISGILLFACTDDFQDINKDPFSFDETSINPALFVSNILQKTFIPNRYPYWRGPLIHGDRFADHVRFGFSSSWWDDGLSYEYSDSYTDAWWSESFKAVPANINELIRLTQEGGPKENQYLYSVALICRALFYQRMTDAFGDIPFSQAGKIDFPTPVYDTQRDIYETLIGDLTAAIGIIGSETSSGGAGFDLKDGDILYGGDLQKWKKLANTLRLRMAIRAYGAEGADFAGPAIQASLGAPLLSEDDDFGGFKHDIKNEWDASGHIFIWWDFSWTNAARWTISKSLVDVLRPVNDPRLGRMIAPAPGGEFVFEKEGVVDFASKWALLKEVLDSQEAQYTFNETADAITVKMPENVNYIGQPARFNSVIQSFIKFELFSVPSAYAVGASREDTDIYPVVILTVAESFFLQAEAVLRNLPGASGNAQQLYQQGMAASMKRWKVPQDEIDAFMTTEAARLTGSSEEQMEKVATQRWLANFMEGFEAWAVLRRTGYPASAAADIPNRTYYHAGTVGDGLPFRMRYPSSEEALNNENMQAAAQRQGGNTQAVKPWWARK